MTGKNLLHILIFSCFLFSCRGPAVHTVPVQPSIPLQKSSCYFFFIPDCPACKASFSKVSALQEKYSHSGLTITAVYSDPLPDSSLLRQTLARYSFDLPVIDDSRLALAKKFKVTVTPQVVLVDSLGTVMYSGLLDNYYYSLGKHRTVVTEHYLDTAIQDVMAGRKPAIAYTEPIGCKINFNASAARD